jgi:uncharacterized metal-binding protein
MKKLLNLWLNIKIHSAWRFQFLLTLIKKVLQKNVFPMIKTTTDKQPLVYSCSGCSSAAQMANYLALQLDRMDVAEMSCIAGVGGNVKNLVRTALSGRKIIVIDGCPLACSKACLSNHNIIADVHVELTAFGVSKKQHEDFNQEEADGILELLKEQISNIDAAAECVSHHESIL